jgi:hypothetical protein
MRRWFTTLAVFVSVIALSGAVFALASTTTQADKAVAKQETASQKKADTEPTYTGTIEKYDASGKVLTIKHKNSDITFDLAADCAVDEGATKLAASDLSGLVGQAAKVYYTAAPGGKMSAHKIVIEKSKASKTTATKSETKPPKK